MHKLTTIGKEGRYFNHFFSGFGWQRVNRKRDEKGAEKVVVLIKKGVTWVSIKLCWLKIMIMINIYVIIQFVTMLHFWHLFRATVSIRIVIYWFFNFSKKATPLDTFLLHRFIHTSISNMQFSMISLRSLLYFSLNFLRVLEIKKKGETIIQQFFVDWHLFWRQNQNESILETHRIKDESFFRMIMNFIK